jgi:hypothetical protein
MTDQTDQTPEATPPPQSVAVRNPFSMEDEAPQREDTLAKAQSARELAEVQGMILLAKRFPRDEKKAADNLLKACCRQTLAEQALYQYTRGGTDVTGPSIRLAEAAAQCWGNVSFGVREIDQNGPESTVEAFAWDMENNVRQVKVFRVSHVRHTKKGSYVLEDPRDIYEMVANQGARRVRACILGVIPGDVIEAAVNQCDVTLATKTPVTPERIKGMVEAFGAFGVTQAMIEARWRRRVDTATPALLAQMGKIHNSIRDGMSRPEDWFDMTQAASAPAQPQQPATNGKPVTPSGVQSLAAKVGKQTA